MKRQGTARKVDEGLWVHTRKRSTASMSWFKNCQKTILSRHGMRFLRFRFGCDLDCLTAPTMAVPTITAHVRQASSTKTS